MTSGDQSSARRLSRSAKRTIMIAADLLMIPTALWFSFALRLGDLVPPIGHLWWLFLLAPLCSIPVFARLGLYHAVIRYIGQRALLTMINGITISAAILAALTLLAGPDGILPRSAFLIYWGVGLLYLSGSRFLLRAYLLRMERVVRPREPVVIYGAGDAGAQLAAALLHGIDFEPVAFIDDHPEHHAAWIHGLRVYPPDHLAELIDVHQIRQVLLAMPSVSRSDRQRVINSLEPYPVHIRTLPSLADIVTGAAAIDELREIDIDDVLGRDPVPPLPGLLESCVSAQVVMVTGAGGSIGSELCRQLLRLGPRQLILYEQNEFALYTIEHELIALREKSGVRIEITPLLGSVLNRKRLESTIGHYGVSTLYHAAAYKHVPLVEHNMIEGVRNNLFGTLITAQAAQQAQIARFVLISTDKAVRPTNVMGASKRLAELTLQALDQQPGSTRFSMVRFGNVLGSSGSVVPRFREQIRRGGPVTVTHREVTRYFMTIPEAAQLVIQAGAMGDGGELFVLDMGEPVRIDDLARKMIHLMGLEQRDEENPDGDIEIIYTGLRPGEKLYEELLIGDHPTPTRHPRILRAEERMIGWEQLAPAIDQIGLLLDSGDCAGLRQKIRELVPEYRPDGEIGDLLWRQAPDRRE